MKNYKLLIIKPPYKGRGMLYQLMAASGYKIYNKLSKYWGRKHTKTMGAGKPYRKQARKMAANFSAPKRIDCPRNP